MYAVSRQVEPSGNSLNPNPDPKQSEARRVGETRLESGVPVTFDCALTSFPRCLKFVVPLPFGVIVVVLEPLP